MWKGGDTNPPAPDMDLVWNSTLHAYSTVFLNCDAFHSAVMMWTNSSLIWWASLRAGSWLPYALAVRRELHPCWTACSDLVMVGAALIDRRYYLFCWVFQCGICFTYYNPYKINDIKKRRQSDNFYGVHYNHRLYCFKLSGCTSRKLIIRRGRSFSTTCRL